MQITLLIAEKKLDDLMHNFNLFENFKHLGFFTAFELPEEKDKKKLLKIIKDIKKTLEVDFYISAIWVKERPSINYVNPNVKVVSNGKQWFLLNEFLTKMEVLC